MADSTWLCAADAQQLSAAFADGRVRPTEALAACLARMEKCDAALGICNHRLAPAELLLAAQAADERWLAGAPLSPLDGIPFGVKANIAVYGQPWHGGIAAFRQRRAAEDAACVARLRAGGMIPVAIFNMHEGALGETSANPAFRTTRNPHNPAHIPGGSSGGSAAAVAAGMVPIALGTDSLGSVRLPSALCGVLGFKPAYGEIPMDGVMPLSPRLDHVGVHARSVADVAQAVALLAPKPGPLSTARSGDRVSAQAVPLLAPEPGEVGSRKSGGRSVADERGHRNFQKSAPQAGAPLSGTRKPIESMKDGSQATRRRQGAWRQAHWCLAPQLRFDRPIAQAFSELLRQHGVVDVVDWSDLDLSALRRAGLLICEREAAHQYAGSVSEHPDGCSEAFQQMLAWGARQPPEKVRRAEAQLAQANSRLRKDLTNSVLLCPTTPHLAPRCGAAAPTTLADLTAPAAIAGLPALSLPMGMAAGNLPMGLQITGPSSDEVLRVAKRHCPGLASIAD